ncbi:OmpA family protein [Empedobacter falsenii]
MEKGVEKIKMTNGRCIADKSFPDKRLVIYPNESITFQVSKWFTGTPEADKKKTIKWMRESNDRKAICGQVDSKTGFVLTLSKKLCSQKSWFYIEASLYGGRDYKNFTGLWVRGETPTLIISSKWCTTNDGVDQRKKLFSFGQNVYLGLDTEGLNGMVLTIEIYRLNEEKTLEKGIEWTMGKITGKEFKATDDDAKTKVFEKQAEVIEGEINVKFTIQPSWKKGEEGNKFYIRVRNGKSYIKDKHNDDIHARYLRVQNKTVPIKENIVVLQNNTPVKVGDANKNVKNQHHCKFEQINIVDNNETFLIFKEGQTKLNKVQPTVQYAKYKVYFDFDKFSIRHDANDTLKYLLDFLLYNQHLDMALNGHADDRGTLDYNQTLSEKRAKAVKDFFIKGGLDARRIKTQGYGEVLPASSGKTEEAYKKNRRVEIDFSYLEYNQDALIYETVTPDVNKSSTITLNVINRSDKGCFREKKHNKNIILVDEINNSKSLTTKQGNQIKQVVNSQNNKFPNNYAVLLAKFLNPFSTIYRSYSFYINSCAYFANTNKPSILVKTYPDIIWIGHFQYNGEATEMTYYFHNKKFSLENGISEVVDTITNSTLFKITKILPSQWIMEYVVLEYIKSEAKSYFYGIHTIHNRTIEKSGEALALVGTETNLIRQTLYTKYVAAAVIYGFVLVGIIIDLLLIYLTRGKNLPGKIQKIAKVVKGAEKVLKRLNDAGPEIIPPKIAINAGMFYKKQKDGKLALVYEANLKADPLIEIDFKREFDLLDLLRKGIENIKGAKHPKDKEANKKLDEGKKNNDKILAYFEKLKENMQIKGTFEAKGKLAFEQNVQFNFLTNSYSFVDKLGNLVATAQDERIVTTQVSFNAKIDGKFSKEFTFNPFQPKIEGKINVQLKGSSGIKLKYGVDSGNKASRNTNTTTSKGLHIIPIVYCSGIEGEYTGSLKASSLFGAYEYETNDGKPIKFVLVEPFEVPLFNIQLFKQ